MAAASARLPVQGLHGDAHPANMLVTADGPVWIDFEDTWRGLVRLVEYLTRPW